MKEQTPHKQIPLTRVVRAGTGFNTPIPLGAGMVDGWKSIEVEPYTEPLIPLGAYSSEAGAVLTSSVYYGEHASSPYAGENRLGGSLLSVFVRAGVARRLLRAQQLLPEDCRLLVFDAYRPLEVQDSLFRFYREQLHLQRPDMDEDALSTETQKYVSMPSSDPTRPSPHNTGGAVDLAIIKLPHAQSVVLKRLERRLANEHLSPEERDTLEARKSVVVRRYGEMLDFGTPFDHGGKRAALAYFETRLASGTALSLEDAEACNNRRLLYTVMTRAGMQAYADEWWHYNAPESQMGATAAGLAKATYGAAPFDAENLTHEQFRRSLYSNALRSGADPRIVNKGWPTEVIGPQGG